MYKDLVEYIVKSLVDSPEEVHITELHEGRSTILELQVAEADMGRVIGKQGRVVNAIRKIIQVKAARQGERVILEVV
ncbi:MAG TPA: KH domain-containing protein [Anaerolineae bacterium]|nr:KH domain-containing protein [Anaerolineae bacterium]